MRLAGDMDTLQANSSLHLKLPWYKSGFFFFKISLCEYGFISRAQVICSGPVGDTLHHRTHQHTLILLLLD